MEAAITSIPAERRILVTAHDAFGYLGRRYGIEVVALQGISTESEFGLADVRSLVDLLVERRIGAVFVESSVSPRGIQAVIEGSTLSRPRGGSRRPVVFRLPGRSRHARRHVYRHGAAQRPGHHGALR